jgi:hypothetical protein
MSRAKLVQERPAKVFTMGGRTGAVSRRRKYGWVLEEAVDGRGMR